ncbi:MAG TPA: NYN domain-containing protein [Thermoanaerobaculales bacterium]|nr:NYN domain-containing protein [Thermoanaerobaculales bacterium]
MPPEPQLKRTVAFFDGQNLFHAAREAFGYTYPNYEPATLANTVCSNAGWKLSQVRFYTGIPDPGVDPFWHGFWVRKLAVLGTRGVWTFSRLLHYRNERLILPDGSETTVPVGRERGVDVRLALDVVRLARAGELDVALLFSQDQDLSEVADEVRAISRSEDRWIKTACAFPVSPTAQNRRGINGAEWLRMDKGLYDDCLDLADYRKQARR